MYNYMSFPLKADMEDFERFPEGPHVGTKAADGELVVAADGSRVKLSSFFKKGVTVVEFGSYT